MVKALIITVFALAGRIGICDAFTQGGRPGLCASAPLEGTEKLKPTIKLKVDDGKIAVLPFIICLF